MAVGDIWTLGKHRLMCGDATKLQKIKRSWPDLHYRTVKGALLLSPSPPVIAPSQLRLVDEFRQSR